MAVIRESFREYRERHGLNASLLTHANKSWKQFKWVSDHGYRPKTDTRVGTALHSFVELLPVERFAELYHIMPEYSKSPDNVTKGGKPSTSRTEWVKEQEASFESSHNGMILHRSQYKRAMRMLGAIQDNVAAMDLIDKADLKEATLTAEICGVDCKGLVDGVTGSCLWDVKTTRNIAPHRFGKTAADLQYVFKMAFYWRLLVANGIDIDEIKLIAVQDTLQHDDGSWSDAPECVVYDVPLIAIENQMTKLERLLEDYKACLAMDDWPGVPDGELAIPNWSMEEMDLVD